MKENLIWNLPELDYEDGLEFLYFYTDGSKGGTPEIREMLQYFKNSREENATSELTRRVHDCVNRVKVMPEVKQEYMVLEEYIWYIQQEAAEEATKKAEEAAKQANKELNIQHILDLLEDYGPIPEGLKEHLEAEEDIEKLNKWHKLAARAGSIPEFIKQIGME